MQNKVALVLCVCALRACVVLSKIRTKRRPPDVYFYKTRSTAMIAKGDCLSIFGIPLFLLLGSKKMKIFIDALSASITIMAYRMRNVTIEAKV